MTVDSIQRIQQPTFHPSGGRPVGPGGTLGGVLALEEPDGRRVPGGVREEPPDGGTVPPPLVGC